MHHLPTDGFLNFGCVLLGGPTTEAAARERVLKRLAPALVATSAAAPKTGYVLQVVVTSGNGGAIVVEGLLSPTLLGIHGATAAANVPSNIPMAQAALADAIGRATASAARSVSGALQMPAFEFTVDQEQTRTK
jgi:mRNA-degrading endonuclease toxin of MazEF toxin-antitoxin module